MNKANNLRTLRTLTSISPLTDMLNETFHENANGRPYNFYGDSDNSKYVYRDKQILFFADSENNRFRREQDFSIRKKHGGLRQLTAPFRRMRELLMSVNDILTQFYEPTPWAYGFVPKRSVVDNARLHVGKKFVLNIDLHDFFPSITFEQVKRCLTSEPYRFSDYAAETIANLCVVYRDGRKHLAQGFPTSPILSNMVCAELDHQLAELAGKSGAVYSRYADDMTFSSDADVLQAPNGEFFRQVKTIIESHGFTLNEKKTRLQRRGQQRQEVTGLNVTDKVNTTRRYMREIRSLLYIWERYGYADACRAAYPHYKTKHGKTKGHMRHVNMAHVLRGKIDYLGMVRGKDDAFYQKCASRLSALMAKSGSDIKQVEYQAWWEARERQNQYLQRMMASRKKSSMWPKVIKIILIVAFMLLLKYIVTILFK